jgi:hypothetical protein
MEIKSITSKSFELYGFVVQGYDFSQLIETLNANTEKPGDSVIYVPGMPGLEVLPVAKELENNLYGGMPIQVGYCNGHNRSLNCLEYHRGSEVNIAADDVILLLAPLQQVKDGKIDTALVEAFALPAGTAVVLYETTLHYAPCCGEGKDAFRVVIVLPKDTNTDKPYIRDKNLEDRLLWAQNKWLIAHPDTSEAKAGAFAGLLGDNITV